jgi:hypothetical protein
MRNTYRSWALAGLMMLALVGCGGGGGDSAVGGGGGSGGGSSPALTITGVAATGAPFTDGTISVIDSRGETVGRNVAVGANGTYSVTLDAGAVAPFVLIASRTDANGDTQQLVSVLASSTQTVANITPITTLIASRLSPSGNPGRLADELAAGNATITPQAVSDVVTEVNTILGGLLTATGTTGFDPLTDTFATDGTGYDRLLDSVSINFLPDSETTTNIEIVVNLALADDTAQPVAVSFNSSDTTAPPTLPTIDPATLVAEGTSARIASFLSQLTACYAIPADQRATAPSTVTATACRESFHQNDPAAFLSNGVVVSSTGAFASLFNPAAVGVVFSQGTYEFTRANGDLVIGYKTRAPNGAETYDTFVVRPDGPEGSGPLRLIGNQYQYGGRVTAYHQRRNFITLDQGAADYFSTGYVIDVPNSQSGGNPLFDRVVVTTPNNSQLVLRPLGGVSFLGISRGDNPLTAVDEGVLTSTNFIRLRAEFVAGTGPAATPREVETSTLVFATPERTEEQLASTPSQGTWRYDYYLAGNTTMTPDTTQYFKHRARALTIGELRTQGLAELSTALVNDIRAGANAANVPRAGQLTFEADDRGEVFTDGGGDGWTVTASQLPPTSITFFGRSPTGVAFTDSVSMLSTARQATVSCSVQGGGDDHCFNGGPGFAAGSSLSGLHLFARDAGGREYANFYALYSLAPAP